MAAIIAAMRGKEWEKHMANRLPFPATEMAGD
jgi:hypothetical protein